MQRCTVQMRVLRLDDIAINSSDPEWCSISFSKPIESMHIAWQQRLSVNAIILYYVAMLPADTALWWTIIFPASVVSTSVLVLAFSVHV